MPRKNKKRMQANIQTISAKQFWKMKRDAQKRDHKLASSGKVPPEAFLLLRPDRLKGAKLEWPDEDLLNDPDVTIGGIDKIEEERHRERLQILKSVKDGTYRPPPNEPLPEYKVVLPRLPAQVKRKRKGK